MVLNNNKHSHSALYPPTYNNFQKWWGFFCLFLASSVAWTPQAMKSFRVHFLQGKYLPLEALKRDKRKTITWVGFSQAEIIRGNSWLSGGREGRNTAEKKLWSPGKGEAGTSRGYWRTSVSAYADSSLGSLCSSLTTSVSLMLSITSSI